MITSNFRLKLRSESILSNRRFDREGKAVKHNITTMYQVESILEKQQLRNITCESIAKQNVNAEGKTNSDSAMFGKPVHTLQSATSGWRDL